jgi:hypothetical protein
MMRARALVPLIVTLLPALSQAELMQIEMTFELQLARVPSIVTTGTSVAEVGGGGIWLSDPTVSIDTVKPYPWTGIPAVEVTLSNLSGFFRISSSTPPLPPSGRMPLPGVLRYCLVSAACDSGEFLVPLLEESGTNVGVGVGGVITFGSFAHGPASLSSTGATGVLRGARWGFDTVSATIDGFVHGPLSGSTSKRKVAGFLHGPASISTTESALQTSGVVQFVTPFQTESSWAGVGGNHFARMTIHFVPEASTFLLLVGGAVGVVLLGSRRR